LPTKIKYPVAAEDWNLNKICIIKAVKCQPLNLMFGIVSITMCDRYTWC